MKKKWKKREKKKGDRKEVCYIIQGTLFFLTSWSFVKQTIEYTMKGENEETGWEGEREREKG